jgi:hypothetical protein
VAETGGSGGGIHHVGGGSSFMAGGGGALMCLFSDKNQPVAEGKGHQEGLECMHEKENKSDDITLMQH